MPSRNLPIELNSFIGRERDLAELTRLLSEARLVTVTGPGGIGKSRIATRLVSRLPDDDLSSVFVRLASMPDPTLLLHVVASTLAVGGEPDQPLFETIVGRLRQGRFLILLDDCDLVIEDTALLAQKLLEACPELRIVATSREPLNIPGEVLWQLDGLPERDAVTLFIERGRQIQRGFGRPEIDSVLVDICRRLDGMPLAIELAAAQIRVMPAEEIRSHLGDRFSLLSVPARADPRHAALKTTLDWSYDLLAEKEQTVFRRLSVFPASFDLPAAAAICGGSVMQIMTRLVAKSLVVALTPAQASGRFRLLDTMRDYGRDRLDESGDRREIEDRLIRFIMSSFDSAGRHLHGPDQKSWFERAEIEIENLRGVLGLTRGREPAAMMHLAADLSWFWFVRCHWAEGLQWIEAALTASPEPSADRARLLSGAMGMARYLNRYSAGRRYADEAMRLFKELGDEPGRAEVLFELGWLALPSRRFDEAEVSFQELLRIGRRRGSTRLLARGFMGLGQLRWRQGAAREARRLLLRSDSLARSTDDVWLRMMIKCFVAHVLHDLRELNQARRYFEEGRRIANELGDRYVAAHAVTSLGYVDLDTQDEVGARINLEKSLPVFMELGQRLDVSLCLDGFALLAVGRQEYARALGLFAAAAGLRDSIGAGWSAEHHARIEVAVARCHKALPALRARQLWREGLSRSIDESVKQVLVRDEPVAVVLSGRERAIATLIGEGMTSAQIATRLKIAERTVDSHAEHIRTKLGLHSRAQIAAWAVRELLIAPPS